MCWIDEQTEIHIIALVVGSLLLDQLAVSVLPMKSEVLWVHQWVGTETLLWVVLLD